MDFMDVINNPEHHNQSFAERSQHWSENALVRVLEIRSRTERRIDKALMYALKLESPGMLDLRRIPMNYMRMQRILDAILENPSKIQKLNMAHCEIAKFRSAFVLLCDFLQTTQLNSVDLSYNVLGRDGLELLVQSLSANPHVEHLRLRHVTIDGAAGVRPLANLLANNHKLLRLKLGKNRHVGLAGAQELARGLASNQHLQELDLDGCVLGDEAAAVIVQALVGHPQLRKLVLSRNQLSLKSLQATTALLSVSAINTRLTNLDLSYNANLFGEMAHLEDEFGEFISPLPLSPDQEATSQAFGEAVGRHRTLKELILIFCDICGECVLPLFRALETKNDEIGTAGRGLENLNIVCNRLGEVGSDALCASLPRMTHVQVLQVDCSASRVGALLQAMAANQSICRFMAPTFMGRTQERDDLSCILQKNRALKRIRSSENDDCSLAFWVPTIARCGNRGDESSLSLKLTAVSQVVRELLPKHADCCVRNR